MATSWGTRFRSSPFQEAEDAVRRRKFLVGPSALAFVPLSLMPTPDTSYKKTEADRWYFVSTHLGGFFMPKRKNEGTSSNRRSQDDPSRTPVARQVTIVAVPPVRALDVFGPAEVFADANRLHGGAPTYKAMTHFFYMDQADPSKVRRWIGSVGPTAF
jgi:hypothetical protein